MSGRGSTLFLKKLTVWRSAGPPTRCPGEGQRGPWEPGGGPRPEGQELAKQIEVCIQGTQVVGLAKAGVVESRVEVPCCRA